MISGLAPSAPRRPPISEAGWPWANVDDCRDLSELRQIDARTVSTQPGRKSRPRAAMFAKGKNASHGNRRSWRRRRVLVIWETPPKARSC